MQEKVNCLWQSAFSLFISARLVNCQNSEFSKSARPNDIVKAIISDEANGDKGAIVDAVLTVIN
jgi:hypothetical protein